MVNDIEYSIVVPVFNSEETLEVLYNRISRVFRYIDKTFEVIFVNDNSTDLSIVQLKELHKKHINILVIDLFKNYGQQNALMCGFNFCSGNYIITLDDDLQNPPEEIPKLIDKMVGGYDAVFGEYEKKKDKRFKNLGSLIVRKLNHRIFNVKNDIKFSSFRILRKEIVEQIKELKTPFPYISGMIMSTSNNVANVIIKHDKREYGKSNYNLKKLISLAFNLIINYSSLPLKIVGYIGLFFSILSSLIGIVFLVQKMVRGDSPIGWTSLAVMVSFFSSIILMFLFILGIYMSRILREVSNSKQYAIKKILK